MDKDPKITDTAEETEGQNTETETPGATRRRLLKAGAVGVPLVVTLQSGTAWAASLTCADKTFDNFNGGTTTQSLVDDMVQETPFDTLSFGLQEYIRGNYGEPSDSDEDRYRIYVEQELLSGFGNFSDGFDRSNSAHVNYIQYAYPSCESSILNNT